jgi:hypothetical protein
LGVSAPIGHPSRPMTVSRELAPLLVSSPDMSDTGAPGDLWTCPRCGARFVSRNMWHSCGPWSVESFLEGKGPGARALFDAFVDVLGRCGPFETAPSKTAVQFMVRVRFAGVRRLSDRGMTCTFWLKRLIESPRFTRVEAIPKNNWIYSFRVTAVEELDDEVLGWLRQAYEVGRRRALEAEPS